MGSRPTVDAALVFVGYGLNIPETGYNDFKGLDLKNKVAVVFTGSPADVPSALSAHYQSRAERWKVLKEAGAIGIIQIPNPASMDLPWSRMALNRAHPSMDLVEPEFDETAGASSALFSIRPTQNCCSQGPAIHSPRLRLSAKTVSPCRTFLCRYPSAPPP